MKKMYSFLPLLGAACLFTLAADANAETKSFDLDEVYPLKPDGQIRLCTSDAEVTITGSDRRDVHLVVDYEAHYSGIYWESDDEPFALEVIPDNGNLIIREKDHHGVCVGILMHSQQIRYRIKMEVPSGASLKLNGDDDDYAIRNVQGKISLDGEDGDATIDGCLGGDYEFDMEDGSIEMKGGKGRLDATLEDGDLTIRDGAFTEIIVKTEDGDMEIATSLRDDGNYRLKSEDGEIELTVLDGGGEFEVNHEGTRVRVSSGFAIEEEDDDLSVYSLPGGAAKVRIYTEDGRVRLSQK